ncbi:MAG: hypothetical protein ACRDTG_28595 [Pseudonocardiaceae bacterium]
MPWLEITTILAGVVTAGLATWIGPAAVARIQARSHPQAEPPPAPERATTALDLLKDALTDLRHRLDAADDHERRIGALETIVLRGHR